MTGKAPASLLAVLVLAPLALAQAEVPAPRPSGARLANPAEVRQRLGLQEYGDSPAIDTLKIAVLDYGFDGLDSGRSYLPANTTVVEHYDPEFVRSHHLGDPDYRKPFEALNRHGRSMAQIIWAVTGSHPQGPHFYLLNANGPTMLRRAVHYAIQEKVDIILFSGSFEGGGNGDGRGPINRAVADALAADILWINAAGNYGHHVYNGPVKIDADGYLRFRDGADGTALRFRNRVDENTVTITLTWNDYRDTEDAGTDKDLDLIVEDASGRRVGASEKVQVSGNREPGPSESRNPRERVVLADLPANLDYNYRIRVRARTRNFSWDDRIRVLVSASRDTYVSPAASGPDDAVTFFDATGKEELYPPADNPLVLTVGDSSPASSVGPTTDHRVKPDVILADSRAYFTDGEMTTGSSNAAAYFAGVVAVLKAAEPGLQTRHLLSLARQGTTAPEPQGATTQLRTMSLPPPTASGSRDTRFYPPPPAAPNPAPAGRVLYVVGPLGRLRMIRVPEPLLPARASAAAPAPAPVGTRKETSPLDGRVWRTPSRARLADVVRRGG
jgi:hypothetical protein